MVGFHIQWKTLLPTTFCFVIFFYDWIYYFLNKNCLNYLSRIWILNIVLTILSATCCIKINVISFLKVQNNLKKLYFLLIFFHVVLDFVSFSIVKFCNMLLRILILFYKSFQVFACNVDKTGQFVIGPCQNNTANNMFLKKSI